MTNLPKLRPYQVEVWRAIMAAVMARDGRSLSVQIARQGGKNELSAQVELLLLFDPNAGDLIKVAPSLRPQGLISLNRLWSHLLQAGLAPPARRHGHAIEFAGNRLLLLSAGKGANVVGHTAGALMEVDEAQDIDPERFSRDFRPMGASRNTPTVFYGTPWTETSLLEEMKQRHLEQERAGEGKRHLEFDWEAVAACNPDYRRFAEAERERLGEGHPAWRTQYCLETVAGAGMLFSAQQRALMQGTHSRARMRTGELEPATIVAGIDVGGEALTAGREQDETVLTLLRVASSLSSPPSPEVPLPILGEGSQRLQILEHLAWRGCSHDELLAELTPLLTRVWRPQAIAIDASGVGEGLAAAIESRLRTLTPRTQVSRYRISEQVKSRLGFGLLAAAGGRLTCYAGDGSAEYHAFWKQVELCRATYKPNRLMGFGVEPSRGHDDYVMSLALAVEAATLVQPARVARGRVRTED